MLVVATSGKHLSTSNMSFRNNDCFRLIFIVLFCVDSHQGLWYVVVVVVVDVDDYDDDDDDVDVVVDDDDDGDDDDVDDDDDDDDGDDDDDAVDHDDDAVDHDDAVDVDYGSPLKLHPPHTKQTPLGEVPMMTPKCRLPRLWRIRSLGISQSHQRNPEQKNNNRKSLVK